MPHATQWPSSSGRRATPLKTTSPSRHGQSRRGIARRSGSCDPTVGGEYLSGAFDQHLATAGTARRLTVHDTPQFNGVAERLNRTLLEQIRAFTYKSGLPKSLWGEGLRHALWLKNRTATRALDGRTPYEALHGEPPDLSGLWRWGRTVLTHHKPKDKLSSRAREGHWIGFDTDSHAHRIYLAEHAHCHCRARCLSGLNSSARGGAHGNPNSPERAYCFRASPHHHQLHHQIRRLLSWTLPFPRHLKILCHLTTLHQPQHPPKLTHLYQKEAPPILRRSARTKKPSRVVRDLQAGVGVKHR